MVEALARPLSAILQRFWSKILRPGAVTVESGEGYSPTLWVGVYRPNFQVLTPFQTRKAIFYTLLKVNSLGGILTYNLGGGVSPKPSNPDPI